METYVKNETCIIELHVNNEDNCKSKFMFRSFTFSLKVLYSKDGILVLLFTWSSVIWKW